MDLETRNATLLSELSSSSSLSSRPSPTDWLPRDPARHVLTSHRAPVTQVSFHPTFSVLASASEDASVKIWDWETGEFERTLKGHTKAVMDVDFDKMGGMLGTSFVGADSLARVRRAQEGISLS
jgi:platelet-activating factor acetylhydrolase IB subunit alpha